MKRSCFVLMPFDGDLEEVYEHAIFPAADSAGFECHRADHASAPRAIIADIIRDIFRADAVVADLTRSNPNVFYELGVAHSVGNKTVMICEKSAEALPFDLKTYRTIFYSRSIDGIRSHLREKIEVALRGLDKWAKDPNNPVQNFRPVQYAVPLQLQSDLEARVAQLEGEVAQLQFEKRRKELLELLFSLPEIEVQHLRNLAADTPFRYDRRPAFLQELRHLRGLGLIRNRPDTTIGGLPDKGDLKDYIELEPIVREFFRDIAKWVSPK